MQLKYKEVVCLDECFLCKINYDPREKIILNGCVLKICEFHFQMATKDCCAFNRFKKENTEIE